MSIRALGRYQIRGEIGRGNMGVVYRAHDPVIERAVAIKTIVLPESLTEAQRETFLKRFFQEARTAGKLLHPNIVVTYDAATDEATGIPFIAMELVEGESLAERLDQEGRIPWQRAADWVIALARALHQAHQEGIVHRDIKPANIMITRQDVPKITDFGIAKLPAANLTQTGVVIGTPYFMSPEQLRGEPLDGRSDLFSLGALLYSLVAGQRPFKGIEIATIASQVLYKSPRPVSETASDVPGALDGVIARALMKAPGERYGSGDELANDLVAVKQGEVPHRAVSLGEQTRQTSASTPPADPTVRADKGAGSSRPAVVAENKPGSSSRRGIGVIVAAAVLVLFSVGLFFREELSQQKIFFDARRAARNGQLQLSEQKLEGLLEQNPDFEKATDLVAEVSSQLVLPELPLELTAKHQHRLGSCTGRLTLREDSLEFSSRDHGRWEWGFEHVRAITARSSRALAVQTYEDDMLGLIDHKNYNFSLLGDSPEGEFWKRYERLFRKRRLGE